MKTIKVLGIAFLTILSFNIASAQSSKTVVQNAMASKNHTTLVAAIKAAGLVKTL